jgi:hypothetical protein
MWRNVNSCCGLKWARVRCAIRLEEGVGWRAVHASEVDAAACWGARACMNLLGLRSQRLVNKNVGVGRCDATLLSSEISLRRPGGLPDLRAPRIFGRLLIDFHPFVTL